MAYRAGALRRHSVSRLEGPSALARRGPGIASEELRDELSNPRELRAGRVRVNGPASGGEHPNLSRSQVEAIADQYQADWEEAIGEPRAKGPYSKESSRAVSYSRRPMSFDERARNS